MSYNKTVMFGKHLLFVFLLSLSLAPLLEAYVKPETDLKGDVQEAELILRLVCVDVREGKMPARRKGLEVPTLEYEFDVVEVLKGDVGKKFYLEQMQITNQVQAMEYGFLGPVPAARFQKGEEYLLFLSEKSSLGVRHVLSKTKEPVSKDLILEIKRLLNPKGMP